MFYNCSFNSWNISNALLWGPSLQDVSKPTLGLLCRQGSVNTWCIQTNPVLTVQRSITTQHIHSKLVCLLCRGPSVHNASRANPVFTMWTKLQTEVHHYTMKPSQPCAYWIESAPSLHDEAKPAQCLLYRKRSITTRWSQASPVLTVQKALHHYTMKPSQPRAYCTKSAPSLHDEAKPAPCLLYKKRSITTRRIQSNPASTVWTEVHHYTLYITKTIPCNPVRKEVHHCKTYPKQSHSILRKNRAITAQHTRNNPTQSCAEVYHCTTYPTGPPLHNVPRASLCLLCK